MKLGTFDLRKRLTLFFAIMIFAIFSVSIIFMYEIGSDLFLKQIYESITSQLPEYEKPHVNITAALPVVKDLQYRMALITGCIIFCLCITFFVLIRSLLNPLNEMLKITRRMAEGHLNETVDVRSNDELSKIGENINDLGVNLQEILLHVWNHTADVIKILEQIKKNIPYQNDGKVSRQIEADIEQINQSMNDIQLLIQGFDLYDIHLDHGKVTADEKRS